ncbi:MAG: CHASE3 domain-containing protein [Caulobacteraceae bacterium]|nr:CHASE3 domain-containing protein [Caulobacteraceae bacterium]
MKQVTIDLRRNGRGNVALERVRAGRGKALMDEFRAMIAAAEAREQGAVIDAMGAGIAAARGCGLSSLSLGFCFWASPRDDFHRAERDEA